MCMVEIRWYYVTILQIRTYLATLGYIHAFQGLPIFGGGMSWQNQIAYVFRVIHLISVLVYFRL